MKILFVRPASSAETIGLQHVMVVEPLELEVLATLTNARHHGVILDMILEKKSIDYFIQKENPDLFCVTGYITHVPQMIGYCRTAKALIPSVITVVGGVHCEVCPEDLEDNSIDYRVVRNATRSFPALVEFLGGEEYFPAGILRKNEKVKPAGLPPFDFYFPIPDRHLTARYRKHYFYIFHDRVALIKTSFGCPFGCNFCFCREITKGSYFERPLIEVIEELKAIREKNIYIVDDDFLTSRTRVKDFIDANRSANLNKNYLLYGRADFIARNADIMEEFKATGLKTVIVGFESFDDYELINYNKNIDSFTNGEAMRILNTLQIDCYATIIVPPDWGPEEFAFCRRKIRELGIHYVNLQPLTPLPGTGTNDEMNQLIIPRGDFEKWDLAHVTLKPVKMNTADFYRNILGLYHSILFQPRFLLKYVKNYSLPMMYKMIKGSYHVNKQYLEKIREAESDA
jgi:hopanoid C-3 methylase